jgi:N-acetylneuraminic acid mutarotase
MKKVLIIILLVLVGSAFLATLQPPVGLATENEWSERKVMPTAREGLGVAWLNGRIYAIGGLNDEAILAVNEEYDPVEDAWEIKEPMPTPRYGFAVAVFQSKIYVFGGTIGTVENSGFTGVTEVYDPVADAWETKAQMLTPRADMCASVVNGKIYLIGGKNYWADSTIYHELDVDEVYDPITDTWTTASSIPVPTFGYASAVVDGKIYIMGGARQFSPSWNNLTTINSNQVYDVQNDTWSNGAELPTPRSYAAAVATSGVTAPEGIYVVGGFDQVDYTSIVQVYDPERNVWKDGTSMPTSRGYLGLAVADDVLYAVGGSDGENWYNVNEEYKPFGYGTVPPILEILSPENRTYATNNVSLILNVNKPTNWIGYSLDEKENITISGDTVFTMLPEGQHRLFVYVNDTFGNAVSSSAIYFYVDTLSPNILIFAPENKTYDESDLQSIVILDEPVSWLAYSLDQQDNVTISSNVTLAALQEGSHNITFYATDLVGNVGVSSTIYFSIATFPIIWIAGVSVTLTIVIAASYLLLKRRKVPTANKSNKEI